MDPSFRVVMRGADGRALTREELADPATITVADILSRGQPMPTPRADRRRSSQASRAGNIVIGWSDERKRHDLGSG